MHEHVSKRVKDALKANGWSKQAWQAYHCTEQKREGYARSNPAFGDAFQMVTSKQGLMGIGCDHIITNSLRVSSVAKHKIREASTSIKHRHAKWE